MGAVTALEPRGELDTVAISVPAVDVDERGANLQTLNAGDVGEQRMGSRKLDGGGFMRWGVGGRVWVEASLPKRVQGDNVEAIGVDDGLDVLEDLYREASGFFEPDRRNGLEGHRFERARIVRLDAVRDFSGVADARWLLDGLAAQPVKGRVRRRRFEDGERNETPTLIVGNRGWSSTLYDKFYETRGMCEPGRMRFEARLRRDVLTSATARDLVGNVVTVADVTEAKVQGLRRWTFERVGYDREVVAMGRLVDVVMADDELSDREKRELWCFLTLPAAGGHLGYSKATAAKYRRHAERLGVTPDAEAFAAGRDVSVRLDYRRGREVVAAA